MRHMKILELKQSNLNNKTVNEIIDEFNISFKETIKNKIMEREKYCWDDIHFGENKILKIEVFPLSDNDNAFSGSVMIIQDISISRYLNNYILQSEKMASIAEVAVGVAHEINNPLFIIQNYIILLKSKITGKKEEEKLLKIEKELGRIVEIIGNLLSFSRMKEIPENKIDLVKIMEEVIILLNHNFTLKKINLKKNFQIKTAEIIGDENRIKQLFLNLITNSIEAVLDGGLIKIIISQNSQLEFFEIFVIDNGYGIPDDIKEKIFKPFFSTKINKKNTGLGLSICQQIVKEHNGIMFFVSTPEKETKFVIRFPLKNDNLLDT